MLAALGDDSAEKPDSGWSESPLEKQLLTYSNQWETKPKSRLLRMEGGRTEGFFFCHFYLELEGTSQMFHPFISTSTSVFLLGVDFIPQQMDGRIRSSPHYTPLLRSLWIQSTKSILLTSAPVHTWHFLQFSRRHQKHQLAARKWKGATDGVR